MAKQKNRVPLGPATTTPFHNPFAKLQPTASLPAGPPAQPPAAPLAEPLALALAGLPQVHLRRERKGRAGKTVTLITGVETLSEANLEELCLMLRKGLGCGATLETHDGTCIIVLQGDQTERAAALLTARGVRRVKS